MGFPGVCCCPPLLRLVDILLSPRVNVASVTPLSWFPPLSLLLFPPFFSPAHSLLVCLLLSTLLPLTPERPGGERRLFKPLHCQRSG